MRCQGCLQTIKADGFCQSCYQDFTRIESSATSDYLALYEYDGLMRQTILRAKVKNHFSAITALKNLFVLDPTVLSTASRLDVIAVMPSSLWGRLRGRFDLAEVLAMALAEHVDRPIATLPRRYYYSHKKRAGNNASDVSHKIDSRSDILLIKDKCVLLIDDIRTTGKSLERATEILIKHGAKFVKSIVLASAKAD